MLKFKSGWVRQKPDHRDWHFRPARRLLRALGPTQDVTSGMGPLLDQQDIGSCGPNTADECIEFDQRAEGLPVTSASRLFIYYATRMIMGTVSQDSGVDNRSLVKALNQYGFCPESLWPYDTSKFTQKPPQACWDAAKANCISNYAAVMQNLDQMRGTLASGFPFIFGFNVYQQMMSDQAAATGILTTPGSSDTPIGGHDVTICGFTTVDLPGIKPGNKWPAGYFRFRNHWTVNNQWWGDGGYGYIPAEYATDQNQGGDFWVLNAVPGTVPNPPTPPQPPTPSNINIIQQMIDGLIAKLKQAIIDQHSFGWRIELKLLEQLQAAIDSYFTPKLGLAVDPHEIRALADLIIPMLQKVFAANPTVLTILTALKAAIDALLP